MRQLVSQAVADSRQPAPLPLSRMPHTPRSLTSITTQQPAINTPPLTLLLHPGGAPERRPGGGGGAGLPGLLHAAGVGAGRLGLGLGLGGDGGPPVRHGLIGGGVVGWWLSVCVGRMWERGWGLEARTYIWWDGGHHMCIEGTTSRLRINVP